MQGEEKSTARYKLLSRLSFKSTDEKGGFRASSFIYGKEYIIEYPIKPISTSIFVNL